VGVHHTFIYQVPFIPSEPTRGRDGRGRNGDGREPDTHVLYPCLQH